MVDFWTTLYEHSDPRTKDWFLMGSFKPVAIIVALYLWISLKAGPHFMRNRTPFDLRITLIIYNAFQVVYNFILALILWSVIATYSLKCQPVDYSNSPIAIRTCLASWLYLMAKIMELLDTVFFVLRKKNNLISFLHVFHHSTMAVVVWFSAKLLPGGHNLFLVALNVTVHVVMYTYYLLAAMGPEYEKYIWWKKYVTKIQLIQFILVFIHMGQLYFRECDFPRPMVHLVVTQALFFFYLFGSFYLKAYFKSNAKRSKSIYDTIKKSL